MSKIGIEYVLLIRDIKTKCAAKSKLAVIKNIDFIGLSQS